jgi:hypothetical protein
LISVKPNTGLRCRPCLHCQATRFTCGVCPQRGVAPALQSRMIPPRRRRWRPRAVRLTWLLAAGDLRWPPETRDDLSSCRLRRPEARFDALCLAHRVNRRRCVRPAEGCAGAESMGSASPAPPPVVPVPAPVVSADRQ